MKIFELNIFWLTISPTYYWLMYAISFVIWYVIILKRWLISKTKLDDLFVYIFAGVILGWRLWYIIFYNLWYYLQNLPDIFKVWEWWMSFHWWVIWVILAIFIFSKKYKQNYLSLTDQVTLILPIWLWLWRIWNYINQELLWFSWYNWLFAININWISYFPSSLLESFLEWLVLFLILNLIYKYYKNINKWVISALFLFFYWIFRLIVEIFFRQPDIQIWYIFWYFTMWEILSLPMIISWIILFIIFNKKWKK